MDRMCAPGLLAWLTLLFVIVASMAAGEDGAAAEVAGYRTGGDYQVGCCYVARWVVAMSPFSHLQGVHIYAALAFTQLGSSREMV